ncbi:MAG: Glyoxalase/bleomycin resistance protein/dioxygenase [Thermoleophilia bacterium]|nr:Glyoxalase/bleomycin resistance protein/dioxygenase [Thermoleophilia bacterium]
MRLLDHAALHVADRDALAQELVDRLDVHVIERTDRFTLLGAHADHGKLTLLDPEDQRRPRANRIVSLVLAEPGIASSSPVELPGGLVCTFVDTSALGLEWADIPRHALVGVTLRSNDPDGAARELERHAMRVRSRAADVALLSVGASDADGRITLTREAWTDQDAPSMLDHVGIRVDDAEGWRARAELDGHEVVKWVEAPHSKAVFLAGPDSIVLEFVEQTARFEGE